MPAPDGGRRRGLTVPRGAVPAALVGRAVRPRRSRSAVGRSDRARGGGGTWRWRVASDLTVGALAPPTAEPVPLPFFPSPYLRLAAISGVRRLAPTIRISRRSALRETRILILIRDYRLGRSKN